MKLLLLAPKTNNHMVRGQPSQKDGRLYKPLSEGMGF